MPTSTKKPISRPVFRWLSHLTCPVLVITAVVMAFPGLVGSNDDPTYALAVVFFSLAIVIGISNYAGGFQGRTSKQCKNVLAAKKYAAGTITLEEHGSHTKEILNDK